MEICLSVVKHGACSKRLTQSKISPTFGLKFRLNFQLVASVFFILPPSQGQEPHCCKFKLFGGHEDEAP
jgi:hypothetical protein